MKIKAVKFAVSLFIMMTISCDEPETVVTNIVHPDGSVTRKIEMRNNENVFDKSKLQVPFDSTWTVKDSCGIDEDGDSMWVKRVEKIFKDVEEINMTYKSDSGSNKTISRYATFKKSFRWFNTVFRFSENIDQKLQNSYPLSDYLNNDELLYFYSPEDVKDEKRWGHDSLKYKGLRDSIKHKMDEWETTNLVSIWINEFSQFVEGIYSGRIAVESLKSQKDKIIDNIMTGGEEIDNLESAGIVLKEYLGEDAYSKFKEYADTSFTKAIDKLMVDFSGYSVRITMPGILTGTNGFIDSSGILLWQVKSDYFLTEPYEMWAESKISNKWAWIVSGLFILFVLTGLVVIKAKKRD